MRVGGLTRYAIARNPRSPSGRGRSKTEQSLTITLMNLPSATSYRPVLLAKPRVHPGAVESG